MLTDDELKDIERAKELDAKATKGPWSLCPHLREPPVDCTCGYKGAIWATPDDCMILEMGAHGQGYEMIPVPGDEIQRKNAAFIVESRTLLPRLAATCERLEAENERLRGLLRKLEWSAADDYYCSGEWCPICHGCSKQLLSGPTPGHRADCELSAALSAKEVQHDTE